MTSPPLALYLMVEISSINGEVGRCAAAARSCRRFSSEGGGMGTDQPDITGNRYRRRNSGHHLQHLVQHGACGSAIRPGSIRWALRTPASKSAGQKPNQGTRISTRPGPHLRAHSPKSAEFNLTNWFAGSPADCWQRRRPPTLDDSDQQPDRHHHLPLRRLRRWLGGISGYLLGRCY